MLKKAGINIMKEDWSCPSVDNRKTILRLDSQAIAAMSGAEAVRKMMEDRYGKNNQGSTDIQWNSWYILPVWQNLESLVHRSRLSAGSAVNSSRSSNSDNSSGCDRNYLKSDYCINKLSDFLNLNLDFDLLSDPMIQAVIQIIRDYADKPLILEVESPFSILGAIMNPMDLYLCLAEEGELLTGILHKIADASAEYILACIDAGCRIISLADPVGTIDLVGEEYYRRYCGESELYLMRQCLPGLDRAIVHICRKMSRSLLLAGMAEAEPYNDKKTGSDFMDTLAAMAEDKKIHFTGLTCIHQSTPSMNTSYIIRPYPHPCGTE